MAIWFVKFCVPVKVRMSVSGTKPLAGVIAMALARHSPCDGGRARAARALAPGAQALGDAR